MDTIADYNKTSIIGWANKNRPHQDDSPQSHAAFLHTLAYNILRSTCQDNTLRSGKPSYTHPAYLAQQPDLTPKQRIIALLHDVLEDSADNDDEHKWTAEDLRAIGFPEDIVTPVIAVSRQDGEPYFDFIQRVARDGGEDGIIIKMRDLRHNSEHQRYAHRMPSKEVDRFDKYNVCYYYLNAVLEGRSPDAETFLIRTDENTPLHSFMRNTPQYAQAPQRCNELLDLFSSDPTRLPVTTRTYDQVITPTFDPDSGFCSYDFRDIWLIGQQGLPAIKKAMQDLGRVQDNARYPRFIRSEKADNTLLMDKSNICWYYLAGIVNDQRGTTVPEVTPGTSVRTFLEAFKINNSKVYDLDIKPIEALVSSRKIAL